MQTAKQGAIELSRPVRSVAALGKLLAVGIILTPLVVMLFPELNQRSRTSSHGKQESSAAAPLASERGLTPVSYLRSDK